MLYRAAQLLIEKHPALLQRAYKELLWVAIRRGFASIERLNDHSSHEHVLMAFDDAIAAAARRRAA